MNTRHACRNERGSLSPAVLGWILLGAGVLINRWTLGLLAPDGHIDGEWRNAQIAGFQALLILAGLVLAVPALRGRANRNGRTRALATVAVPALATLIMYSGFGVYLYLSGHQHTIDLSRVGTATPEQLQWAEDIRKRGWEVALKNGWFDIEKAKRDGFELQWSDTEHYVNREYLFDDEVLNIEKPEFLLYLDSPRGKLLVGYMFFTRKLEDHGPTPFGPLGAWHFHPWPGRGYCAIDEMLVVSRPDEQGHCAEGVRVDRSAEMLHVYLIEHPLGTFADAMVFSNGNARFSIAWVHPILVHFTIALLLLAVVLDVIGWLARREFLHRVAFVNLAVVAVITLGTMAAGMAAEMNVQMTESDHATLHTHKYFAFSVVAVVIVLALWRSALGGRFPRRAAPLYLVLALSAAGLTVTTAYWGGELVYRHGVSVAAIDKFAFENYMRQVDRALGRPPSP
jgi:uncharacterized membrane protein